MAARGAAVISATLALALAAGVSGSHRLGGLVVHHGAERVRHQQPGDRARLRVVRRGHRVAPPAHPVGWMYAAGGALQLVTAVCAPLAQSMHDAGASRVAVEVVVTVFAFAWPIHIGVALPLSLLLLPDGRLPSPRWRPLALAVAITAPLFVVEVGTSGPPVSGLPDGLWVLPRSGAWTTLWTLSEARWALSMLVGLIALCVRYRRGDEVVRQQLLWMLSAAAAIFAAVTPWALIAGTPVAVLFAIPLLPVAIAVAIVRHGLLDIRLVLARGLSYGLLSALVLAGYVLLVLALSGVASALIVALLAFPLRARLQRAAKASSTATATRCASHPGSGNGSSISPAAWTRSER